jgi:thioesterase domain-containing protein
MLCSTCSLSQRILPLATTNLRRFAVAAAKAAEKSTPDVITQLEHENARMLRVVKKRVKERSLLLSQVSTHSAYRTHTLILFQLSEEMSSPQDVLRLKQLKESKALQTAWDEWTQTRQVVLHFFCSHFKPQTDHTL